MSYPFYKLLHLLGVILVFTALGGAIVRTKWPEQTAPWKKVIAITHGIGLLVLLVAGFGLLARLGVSWPWQGWTIAKVVIWLVVGGLIGLINRKPEASTALWWVAILLGTAAAYLGVFKPF